LRWAGVICAAGPPAGQSMIPKSLPVFQKKIMLKQQAKAKCRFNLKLFRFSATAMEDHVG